MPEPLPAPDRLRRLGTVLLPDRVTPWVRWTAWASLVANMLLVVTGGLVRLTGSGLGCPTWPRCTSASWTATPEMGVHGVIEFGNRMLTFVLSVVAVLTYLAVRRLRREHPDLHLLALLLGLGIVVQAVVGGITVRTHLNPWVVGIHFLVSGVMIALAALLLARVRRLTLARAFTDEAPAGLTPGDVRLARVGAWVLALATAATVYLGTLVTGTGPHSGDAAVTVRHPFRTLVVARLHAFPVYVLVLTTVVGLVLAVRRGWPASVRRILILLTVILLGQAAVGYYQFFHRLPVAAVAVHLLGAATLVAVVTLVVDRLHAVSAAGASAVQTSSGDAGADITARV